MNYIWSGMILGGICFAAVNGTLSQMTEAVLSSAKEAVTLCITMSGVMAFWLGLMKIAENSGMIKNMVKKLSPVLKFLFPSITEDDSSFSYIGINIISNILGLGWAATPAGIRAMEELQKKNIRNCEKYGENKFRGKTIATKEMCDFLIINISSLQIIPVNVISYRMQYGSVHPTAIIGPAFAATAVSTLTAVLFCKFIK